MTANATPEDREKCLQAGMDDYLPKPMRPDALALVLEKWLPQQAPSVPIQAEPATSAPSPSASPSTDHPAVNIQTLKELEDLGGREFLQFTIQKFVEDALQCMGLIEQALDSHDQAQIQKAAHGLKGIARNMGADSLAHVASELGKACRVEKLASLIGLQTTIQDTFQRTRQELEKVAGKSEKGQTFLNRANSPG